MPRTGVNEARVKIEELYEVLTTIKAEFGERAMPAIEAAKDHLNEIVKLVAFIEEL